MTKLLVNAEWLNNNLDDPDLIILDASQKTNTSRISTGFTQIKIKKARIFSLKEDFSLKTTDLPNMLPTPKQFEQACQKIGINKASKIVVYDNLGIYFSPRVWWMFKTMGHEQIWVLNGGL
ncbi:MAG: rhodanese-like domain-containing protein, partial [Leeuwenhoekiella sp.]